MKLVKVKSLFLALALLIIPLITSPLHSEPVELALKTETESVQPGSPFWMALDLTMEDGWHAYWKNPGDAGMAPQIVWTLPEGFEVEAVEWPYPNGFEVGPLEAYGYSEKAVLLAKIRPPAKTDLSKAEIKADVRWVVCNDETCLPGSSESSVSLTIESTPPLSTLSEKEFFEKARQKIPQSMPLLSLEINGTSKEAVICLSSEAMAGFEKARFFPETGKVSFSKRPHPTEPDHYILSFKIAEGETELPSKGVLVAEEKSYELQLAEDTSVALADSVPSLKAPASHTDALDSLLVALVFAFLGGIILNLMPCVLPVVALKVLDFVNLAGQDRWHTLKHGLFFALGVLVSFWALAGLLLVLQSLGESVGWGFQLQEPAFVAGLAMLMVVFALSLFGVFEMGVVFASWAGQKEHSKKSNAQEGSHSYAAFFSGVLATAVATPCTGPFLGSAIGYAVTLPPAGALAIFTSLGLGMALPYLLLTAFPQLLRFIPRPGKWMDTFRQAMGFMMLIAALWLTWVFASQTLEPASIILLGAFLLIGIACWILGNWATPYKKKRTRLISWVAAVLLVAVSFKAVSFASSLQRSSAMEEKGIVAEGDWEEFSPVRLKELKDKGIPVFVDFTAKWCITCQFNHMALSTASVESKIKEKGIIKMKADWTQRNPVITEEMKKFGRSGVPLYVLYEGEQPQILPQTLTPDIVISSFEKIKNAR